MCLKKKKNQKKSKENSRFPFFNKESEKKKTGKKEFLYIDLRQRKCNQNAMATTATNKHICSVKKNLPLHIQT